jgi:hypothetical protein
LAAILILVGLVVAEQVLPEGLAAILFMGVRVAVVLDRVLMLLAAQVYSLAMVEQVFQIAQELQHLDRFRGVAVAVLKAAPVAQVVMVKSF